MPDLGCVVDSDGLVRLHPGFHQRYERARWDKRMLCSTQHSIQEIETHLYEGIESV